MAKKAETAAGKRWEGESFILRLSLVRDPKKLRPGVETYTVPTVLSEALHELYGGITGATARIHAEAFGRLADHETGLAIILKHEVQAQQAKALCGVPTEVLQAALRQREDE